MVGDALLKHFGQLEVFNATTKTFRRRNWTVAGFSWSLIVRQMVDDRSWVGRGPISDCCLEVIGTRQPLL